MKFLMLSLLTLGSFALQAQNWDDYVLEKASVVSHRRHIPFRLDHGKKTKTSVLLIHGIFSSPLHFHSMAEAFYKNGHNVVTVLLPGHWEKDLLSIDKLDSFAWTKEVNRGLELALEAGDQVIVAGHSLGGLLAIEQALKNPKDVAAVVAFSPALKVWDAVLIACRTGVWSGLYGNHFLRKKPNGVDVPYFAPRGGILIQELADRVVRAKLKVPIYVAYTQNDIEVDVLFLRRYVRDLKAIKRIRTYGVMSGINHGNISQSPRDVPSFGNNQNPDFDNMMADALKFLQSLNL